MTTVWLHGAGLSGASWAGVAGLTPDLPGHGSEPRAVTPTIESFADALLPKIPDRLHLVGHSLGGMVAVELAARLKGRVLSLVTVEAVPTVHLTRFSTLAAHIAMGLFRLIGPRGVAALSGIGQPKAVGRHIKPLIAQMDRGGMEDALTAAFSYDARPRLPDVTAPALVIAGRGNPQTHRGARLMAKELDAPFELMKGGHILHIEQPDALRDRIRKFQEAQS
ncbi:alpha/beta fold hydrolase [Aestuariibius sp. 2305UL40-4]|uniref:alpha/beta fold hydrolase n=1 Tax=Aestuariibius violaceus TaxID=3234132 RepID=UPI00345EC742